MAKAKLKFNTAELGKLKVASEFTGVQINDTKLLGNVASVEISHRNPQDFADCMRTLDKVTDEQVKQAIEEAKKAETKAEPKTPKMTAGK